LIVKVVKSMCSASSSAMIAGKYQSRRAQEPDRGQRHPDGEPHLAGGAHLRPVRSDEPALGDLSDPDHSRRAEVEIELIDRPREKPWGAGEPTAAVVPSAISNAVFDAPGARLRSVAFTPAKVKAAIDRT
jgi:hypothetical protein